MFYKVAPKLICWVSNHSKLFICLDLLLYKLCVSLFLINKYCFLLVKCLTLKNIKYILIKSSKLKFFDSSLSIQSTQSNK